LTGVGGYIAAVSHHPQRISARDSRLKKLEKLNLRSTVNMTKASSGPQSIFSVNRLWKFPQVSRFRKYIFAEA